MKSFVVVTGLVGLTACSSLKNYPARGFGSQAQPTETTAAQVATPVPQQQQNVQQQGPQQQYAQPQQQGPQQQVGQQGQQQGQQQGVQGQNQPLATGAQTKQTGTQAPGVVTPQSKQTTVAAKSTTIPGTTPTTTVPVVSPPPAGLIVTADPENRFQLWVPEGTRRESKRGGEKLWVVFTKEADITINVKKLTKRELTEAMATKESVGGTPEVVGGEGRLYASSSEGIASFDLFRDGYAIECYGPTDARARLRQMCTSFQPLKH